jgi:hypothetical protein
MLFLSKYRFMIRNPRGMDDLHGCRKFPEATGSRRDADVFINHIPVVYPSGSYAVQIAPAICYAVLNHKTVLAIQRTIRAKVSKKYIHTNYLANFRVILVASAHTQ